MPHLKKLHLPHRWPYVLAFFLLLALLLRFPSFFRSMINHDESTYIVVSQMMLEGHTYWIDVIDTKPVGIMLLYGLFHLLNFFGHIAFFRLAATIFLAATSLLLFHLVKVMGGSDNSGWAAGTIYLLMTSIFTFFGVSPNTEVYFNFFTAAGFLIFLSGRNPVRGLLAGLVIGLGFMVKYVVLFDATTLGIWVLWMTLRAGKTWKATFISLAGLGLGILIPFLACWAWYETKGYGEAFRFFSFELGGRYVNTAGLQRYLASLLDFSFRYSPVLLLGIFALKSSYMSFKAKALSLLWTAFALTAVLIPGRFFAHYYLQLMLPVCFTAGFFFNIEKTNLPTWLRWSPRSRIWWILLALFIPVNMLLMKKDYIDRPDVGRLVAEEIRDDFSAEDGLYTTNTNYQILYFLLQTPSPTPYVHGSLLWTKQNRYAVNADKKAELNKIFAHPPRFVLIENHKWPKWSAEKYLQHHLPEKYSLYTRREVKGMDPESKIALFEFKK